MSYQFKKLTTRLQTYLTSKGLGYPRFSQLLHARRRIHYKVRGAIGSNKPPIFELETKLGAKQLAEAAGVRYPKVLQGPFNSCREFDTQKLPGRFVVKPNWGAGGHGVVIVERRGQKLYDLKTSCELRFKDGQIADELVLVGRGSDGLVFAEEMVFYDGIPCDFKLYCFYGQVGLIAQIVQGERKRFKFYNAAGKNMGNIRSDVVIDQSLTPPNCLVEIIDAGKRISKLIQTPFIRVDLFEDNDDVVFGELALRPGGKQMFNKRIDLMLGDMWEAATAELVKEHGGVHIP